MGCSSSAQVKYENGEANGKDAVISASHSTSSRAGSNKVGKGKLSRMSITENKINQALLKKKLEHAVDSKPLTFERILLRFDKLRVVLGYVKQQFNQVANDQGKLSHEGLEEAMKRLHVNMSLNDILDLFDFVNVQEKKEISMKEFLVALTIGMVLDAIPSLVDGAPVQTGSPSQSPAAAVGKKSVGAPKPGPGMLRRSFSGFLGHNLEIKEMLNLIVSAYLIFDPEGKGYIEKSGIEKMLAEDGKQGGNNAMLSQQRWDEMDWDANGTIDFAEFVFSFTSWVDLDMETEEA